MSDCADDGKEDFRSYPMGIWCNGDAMYGCDDNDDVIFNERGVITGFCCCM